MSRVLCGVPQSSVLGLIPFPLYTAEVVDITRRHGFNAHSYADNMTLSFHSKASSRISDLVARIDDINFWMLSNRLNLNTDKMQFIWLGTSSK
jgi:hypothetical protein